MGRSETRRAYEFVLAVVDHNTGGLQPDALDELHLLVHVENSSFTTDQARTALRAALHNGDLVETEAGYRRPDGGGP